MKRILKAIVIAILVIYAAAASVPYINQSTYWFISILGVIFPWIFFLVIAIGIYLAFRRSRWSFLVLLLLLLSWQSVVSTFGIHYFGGETEVQTARTSLRVLSWNVARWDQMKAIEQLETSNRGAMLSEILKENADIMCFHEFFEPSGGGLKYYQSNIEAIRAKGYPYYVFFPSSAIHNGTKKFGMAIFSRFPIVDSATYSFGNTPHSEGLMCADVKIDSQIIRVYTTHLESFKTGRSGLLSSANAGMVNKAKNTIWSVRNAYRNRHLQMEFVNDKINSGPYPVLFLGNLGDIPNSQTYTILNQNFKDAFVSFGSGFGATYPGILPNLRLDYIFVDKKIKIKNFHIVESGYSDHYPIAADLSLAL